MSRPERFDKIDLKPKRWHGYSVVLFILGSLFPPLAVAARFGIGSDFFINLVLTLCGYFPGHFHNFYIQNVRNNKNNKRTPKWAIRYGLVDDTAMKRRAKRSQWATRYNERTPNSALEGQEVEDGQVPDRTPTDTPSEARNANTLWNNTDEGFYGQQQRDSGSLATSDSGQQSGGRWHYPANFDDIEPTTPASTKRSKSGRKKEKKDRWARTEDAHAAPPKKKKSKSRTADTNGDWINDAPSRDEPEDAVGGLYGPPSSAVPTGDNRNGGDEGLDHEF